MVPGTKNRIFQCVWQKKLSVILFIETFFYWKNKSYSLSMLFAKFVTFKVTLGFELTVIVGFGVIILKFGFLN